MYLIRLENSNLKNIKDLEENQEYKVERFEKVKTKYGSSILCCLEEYKIHLPRRFVSKLDDKIIKDLKIIKLLKI